jgi:porin
VTACQAPTSWCLAVLSILAVLIARPVAAQDDPGFIPATPRTTPATSPLNGTVLEPAVRVGQDLLDAGILPRLRTVDSFAANPYGGLSQGTDASGVVIFGADFDMNRIAGAPGLLLHADFGQLYGHELSTDHIGSRTKVQSYYYPYKQFELTELTLEQSFWGDRLNVLAGRANATGEFARDTYGCRFEGVADCPFELTQYIAGFPGFPYVNWGGRVRVRPSESTYVKVGAYELNSRRNRTSGFDWGLNNSTGFVLPVEAGYETTYATDPMPRHYKVGFWFNSSDYTDPFLNTQHRSRAKYGGTALTYTNGREGFYALGDQVVWRHDTESRRGVAVFGAAGAPLDGREPFAFQGVLGGLWTGPFAARPDDQLGVLGSFIRLSDKEDGYLNALLVKAGSHTLISRESFVFEVNYTVQVAPGVLFEPAVQYLVNPDDISRTTARFAPKDALVLGAKFVLNAGELLGLPEQLPAYKLSGG